MWRRNKFTLTRFRGSSADAHPWYMKAFTHMSCKCIKMLETIFTSSKTMPAYLQYGKELFANLSCHTPLADLLGPDQSPISHPWDILDRRIHASIHSQLPHFQNLNINWLNNGNVFHEGVGYNPWLLLSMRKSLIEYIHKGGGHPRYDLQYINL